MEGKSISLVEGKRGLFSTRSPYRPNPLGMSVVRLRGVRGLVIDIEDVDILDGTPVLDIKPYVAYADSFPDSGAGWLDGEQGGAAAAARSPAADRKTEGAPRAPADPIGDYTVTFSPLGTAQVEWLAEHGKELRETIEKTLRIGPQPHAYRRIRKEGDTLVLASKEWRIRFVIDGRRVTIVSLFSGFRPRELALGTAPELPLHRQFVERFGV